MPSTLRHRKVSTVIARLGFTPLSGLLFLIHALVAAPAAWSQFPSNDQFSAAQLLQGDSALAGGSNFLASREPVEPYHAGRTGGRSVWFRWTPARPGIANIQVYGASFPALLAVYTGTSVSNLWPVIQGVGYFGSISLSFKTDAGTDYKIAVDGVDGAHGAFAISASLMGGGPVAGSENDDFYNRVHLTETVGMPIVTSGSLRGAGLQTHEPPQHQPARSSVWYQWNPTRSQAFELRISGSYSRVQLYQGTSLLGLVPVAPERSFIEKGLGVIRFGSSMEPYQIAVLESTAEGGEFTMQIFSGWPQHDSLQTPLPLNDYGIVHQESNARASTDSGEPPPATGASGKTLWYSFRAPASGAVAVEFSGVSMTPVVSVFKKAEQGSIHTALGVLGDPTVMTFHAEHGERFLLAFDSLESHGGAFQFELKRGAGAFDKWITAYPQLKGADAGPAADPDRDGLTNLEEMAYGLEPKVADHPGGLHQGVRRMPTLTVHSDNLRLTHGTLAADFLTFAGWPQVTIEQSADLQSWERIASAAIGNGLIEATIPRKNTSLPARWFRFRVTPATVPAE